MALCPMWIHIAQDGDWQPVLLSGEDAVTTRGPIDFGQLSGMGMDVMAPSWALMDLEVVRLARRRVERLEAELLRYLTACVPIEELTIVDVLGHDDHVMHVSQVDDYVDSVRRTPFYPPQCGSLFRGITLT